MTDYQDDAGKALRARMIVGKLMADSWKANPPDPADQIRTLTGCAELYLRAADHLAADPPDWREAVRCIKAALDAGYEIHGQAYMAYAYSDQAVDDLLGKVRDAIDRGEADDE